MRKALATQALAFTLLAAITFPAALLAVAADDLKPVLNKLDATSKTFKSAQADILWDTVQTQPTLDKVTQAGTMLIARVGGESKLALHIKTTNGTPTLKDMVYAGGIGKLYSPSIKQMQVFPIGDKKAALDAFLTLGFGGSGQDLEKNWTVTQQGNEPVNGVSAVKLQLIPRDPSIAQTTTKVLLWIDMSQGIAVRQQQFNSDGTYKVVTYSNIHVNAKVPGGAFEIKTAPGTQIINH